MKDVHPECVQLLADNFVIQTLTNILSKKQQMGRLNFV